MKNDMVITPGGARLKSLVHMIEAGHSVDGREGVLRELAPSGKVVAELGPLVPRPGNAPLMPGNVVMPSATVPGLPGGWIVYAGWRNETGTPISSFKTTWIVPPPPATKSGQLIYLFNGIQNQTMIYQPVLQWGNNGVFGGDYWVVASWYADGQGGAAMYTTPVQVNPGDVLVGIMTLTGKSGNLFNYNCIFQGIANSSLNITNQQELTGCSQTLEAYNLTQCSDYPNTDVTAMTAINIQTGNVHPTVVWTPDTPVTGCGQNAAVASNSSVNGEVDLYYHVSTAPDVPVPLYRYWNPKIADHFYTTNWAELGAGKYGWVYEGIQCYVHAKALLQTVPLYRYWNPQIGDHFYTTNWKELGSGKYGWGYEGIQCYVHTQPVFKSVPLYRYWNSQAGDHFYTTNWGELGSGKYGWAYEGVQCYVHTSAVLTPGTEGGCSEPESDAEAALPPTFDVLGGAATVQPIPAIFSAATSPSFASAGTETEAPASFRLSPAPSGDTVPDSFRTAANASVAEQLGKRNVTIIMD